MKTIMRTNGTLFPSMPSLFNDLFPDEWIDSSHANWKTSGASLLAVNVKETNDDYQLEVAAPGMKRDAFKVELDNNVLTISAQQEEKHDDNEQYSAYSRREFSYQSFQRSFSLPGSKVDGEKIAAKYVDGILHITIPKREEAKIKPAKQIKVV